MEPARIEEVYKDIYKIYVPLTGNPLKYLNSYYIKSRGKQLLIDAGFNRPECEAALREALTELGADFDTLDMAATHLHSDHAGLFEAFMGDGRKSYMSRIDVERSLQNKNHDAGKKRDCVYNKEGYTFEMQHLQRTQNPAFAEWMRDPASIPFTRMDEGDIIEVGEYKLEWIIVPGHTPGNAMLWEPDHRIMFTGDHVLFDITPNIPYWEGRDDILGDYLENLKRVRDYPVKLVLPAHRTLPTISMAERIDQLLAHHEARLAEAYGIIKENPGLRGIEIAGRMTWQIRAKNWEDFPLPQKWFAVGECMTHLDHLIHMGKIRRDETDTKRQYYVV